MSSFTVPPDDADSRSVLYEPWSVRECTFVNKIVMAPMCTYSAPTSEVTEWHVAHYGTIAKGGVGAICIEATAVEPRGRLSEYDLGIWSSEHIDGLKRIADFVHSHSTSKVGIQLGHSGRKGTLIMGTSDYAGEAEGVELLAPSCIPYDDKRPIKREASIEAIEKVIEAFVDGAKRSVAANMDFVELHSAHGYLLHQFLSPLSNQRTDQYGGSLENRCRLTIEIAQAVRDILPVTMPLLVRLSATDWYQGGWDIDSSVYLAKALKDVGVDVIDVSSGGLHPRQEIEIGWLYQIPFAAEIRERAAVPTIAVGGIDDATVASMIITSGKADAVAVGRVLLRSPYWPRMEAHRLRMSIPVPSQEARGYKQIPRSLGTVRASHTPTSVPQGRGLEEALTAAPSS